MIQKDVQLKEYTTLKIGGPAEFFTTVKSEAELVSAVRHAKSENHEIHIIGGGSNILIGDSGLSGLTIKNEITGWSESINDNEVSVTIGAGEVLDRAIAYTVLKKYWGLENLSHIPGSVGAAPVQNIGAYGVEIKDVIKSVKVFNTETEEFQILENNDCQFAYRDSIFKHSDGKKYIVTNVTFALNSLANPVLTYKDLNEAFGSEESPNIEDIRNTIIEIRSKKFPDWTLVGTAGSFFKNPIVRRVTYEKLRGEFSGLPGFDVSDIDVKIPLGWILDNVCGLKGIEKGNVGTYKDQALVLVNNGNSTESEISEFAQEITDTVFEKVGLKIEWEVTKMK